MASIKFILLSQSPKNSLLANFTNKIWILATSIFLVPIYIKLLGNEAYGLIAFYTTLLSAIMILDLGLSITLSRELPIRLSNKTPFSQIKNLVFSIEIIYIAVGIFIGLVIFLCSNYISLHWINSSVLSPILVQEAVILMGIVIACQWTIALYTGALVGLQYQTVNSLVSILFVTVRSLGVLAALYFIEPSIIIYFKWQAGVSLIYALSMHVIVWYLLPKAANPVSFSVSELKTIWRFAIGMTGISLVTFFINQADKIIVSKYVSLENVGYYGIAFTVVGSISMLATQIQPIVLPLLTKYISQNDDSKTIQCYHKYCRLISILTIPVGISLIVFIKDILWIWTNNENLSGQVAPVVRILVVGTICNNLMITPYMLLLAKGATNFTFYQNVVAGIFLVPLLFYWVNLWGIQGAALVWCTVNLGYFFISIPLIHWKYLRYQNKIWYLKDVLPFMGLSIAVYLVIFFLEKTLQIPRNLLTISFYIFFVLLINFLAEADYRARILIQLNYYKNRFL